MVAGFDRYYQIVKCFRDEDLRADRQPEFTQIDIETSFLDETEIRTMMEQMVRVVFQRVLDVSTCRNRFRSCRTREAMSAFWFRQAGLAHPSRADRTHRRDARRRVQGVQGRRPRLDDGSIAALRMPGGGEMPRSEIDSYTEFVKIYGAKGLAYIKVNQLGSDVRHGLQSPIVKNLHDAALTEIHRTHAGARRRPHLLRRRPRQDRQRRAGRAADEDRPQRIRPQERAFNQRLAAAVGGRFSDVRVRRGGRPFRRRASSVHEPEGWSISTICRPTRRRRSPRRMTWR